MNHPTPTTWLPAQAPDIEAGRTTGRLTCCQFCGSMHPTHVAAAIRAGAVGHWADRKYGWPHKAYFDAVPNPHEGMLESRMSASHATPTCPKTGAPCAEVEGTQSFSNPQCECMRNGTAKEGDADGRAVEVRPSYTGLLDWQEKGKPAGATTWGKFYSIHLRDATPEDKETIEQHLGYRFEFSAEGITWTRIEG